MTATEIGESVRFATEIRKLALQGIGNLGVGHVGGTMSIIDALAVLYGRWINCDPQNPSKIDRDRLVLSKGHAGPALYATLSLVGFFPQEWLLTLNCGGTRLPSHCDRNLTPGIDMTTGSLGQGLSAACGMALGYKIDGINGWIYCIIGDGETDEGQIWEAAMFASQYRLKRLIAFTDYNKMQIDGPTQEVMDLGDIEGKWQSFGWNVLRADGHDHELIDSAICSARNSKEKPTMIILDTIKGKGCSFAEGDLNSHNMSVSPAQLKDALEALDRELR
ncbi:transketolase [Marispirochaeta aestuarii]|uniref:Transketolase n=1 Tax=Marispirochaeta aestuarii TaxID=1963862 RepID=A0A1Y1RZ83_9SPIO|nr:transketolase [Marispirochaeta aestuarii]ORC35969.1 transketolase [Marispirochaeta aestuarii]